MYLILPVIIAHSAIALFLVYRFLRSIFRNSRNKVTFKKSQFGVEIMTSLIMICCFAVNNMFELKMKYETGYLTFSVISILSLVGYWTHKFIGPKYRIAKRVSTIFIGILFWMALIVSIKLAPLYLFFIFPLYGFFVIGPLLILLMTVAEIINNETVKPAIVLGSSLGILIIVTVVLNLFNSNPWSFLHFLTQFSEPLI